MLKAKAFLLGLGDIYSFGLWGVVFEVPPNVELSQNAHPVANIPDFSYNCTKYFIQSLSDNGWVTEKELMSKEEEEEDKDKCMDKEEKEGEKEKEKEKGKNKKKEKICYP